MKNFSPLAQSNVQPAVVAGLSASFATKADKASAPYASGVMRRYLQKAAFVLLALGGSFLASPALAQDSDPVTVKKVSETAFRVRIQNPTQQGGRMQVMNLASGRTLLDERYNSPAYGCDVDFSNLPSGQYRIVMQVGKSKYRYMVEVQSQLQRSAALGAFTVETRVPKKMTPASASL